jgi:hypothetical protein
MKPAWCWSNGHCHRLDMKKTTSFKASRTH